MSINQVDLFKTMLRKYIDEYFIALLLSPYQNWNTQNFKEKN